MIAIYAICTILGVVALVGWVALGMAASAGEAKDRLDPEIRFGERGRMVVAAVLGFGFAGMSASFAGWNSGVTMVAALAGGGIAVLAARYLGVEEDPDGGSA